MLWARTFAALWYVSPPNWRSGPDGGLGSSKRQKRGEMEECATEVNFLFEAPVSFDSLSGWIFWNSLFVLFLWTTRIVPAIGTCLYRVWCIPVAGESCRNPPVQSHFTSLGYVTSPSLCYPVCLVCPACPASALTCCARCTNPNYEGEVPTSRPTRALCLCFPGRITVPPPPPRNCSCRYSVVDSWTTPYTETGVGYGCDGWFVPWIQFAMLAFPPLDPTEYRSTERDSQRQRMWSDNQPRLVCLLWRRPSRSC